MQTSSRTSSLVSSAYILVCAHTGQFGIIGLQGVIGVTVTQGNLKTLRNSWKGCKVYFSATFPWTWPLSDCKVPNVVFRREKRGKPKIVILLPLCGKCKTFPCKQYSWVRQRLNVLWQGSGKRQNTWLFRLSVLHLTKHERAAMHNFKANLTQVCFVPSLRPQSSSNVSLKSRGVHNCLYAPINVKPQGGGEAGRPRGI